MCSCCHFAYRCDTFDILTPTSRVHTFLALDVVPMLKQRMYHHLAPFSSSFIPMRLALSIPFQIRSQQSPHAPLSSGTGQAAGQNMVGLLKQNNVMVENKLTCMRSISSRAVVTVASQPACI